MRGLEPPRCRHHRLLRPARLPVPPHPRKGNSLYERRLEGVKKGTCILPETLPNADFDLRNSVVCCQIEKVLPIAAKPCAPLRQCPGGSTVTKTGVVTVEVPIAHPDSPRHKNTIAPDA